MIQIKFSFFRYPWLFVAIPTVVFIVIVKFQSTGDWGLPITVAGTGLSLIYFAQKQRLEELHLFNALFKDFNERYDCLNDDLTKIACENEETSLDKDSKEVLVKYFNLCGEEYLYYSLGYIYPQVWNAWKKGMCYYASNKRIQDFWEEELSTGSYYELSMNYILKSCKERS